MFLKKRSIKTPIIRLRGALPSFDLSLPVSVVGRLVRFAHGLSLEWARVPYMIPVSEAATSSVSVWSTIFSSDQSAIESIPASEVPLFICEFFSLFQVVALKQEDLVLIMGSEQKASQLLEDLQIPPDGTVSPQVLRTWWSAQKQRLQSDQILSIRFELTTVRLTVTDDSSIETKGVSAQHNLFSFLLTSAVLQVQQRTFDTCIKFDIDQISIDSFSQVGERYNLLAAKSTDQLKAKSKDQSTGFFSIKIDILDSQSPSSTPDSFPTVTISNFFLLLISCPLSGDNNPCWNFACFA